MTEAEALGEEDLDVPAEVADEAAAELNAEYQQEDEVI